MSIDKDDNSSAIQILIVEDHPIFRKGLVDLIEGEPDFVVCGWVEDVAKAKKAISNIHPDLVVLDLALSKSNGLDLLAAIKEEQEDLPVLVLSMHDEQVYAERCLHLGARGYINKQETSTSVITAIRQILKGNVFLSIKMTAQILNRYRKGGDTLSASPFKLLTNRELEVFHLIGKGVRPNDIARKLHISAKTVYAHTEKIKEKMGIRHSTELVRHAALWIEQGNLKHDI